MDSTPDLSHVDQLILIARYVQELIERFLHEAKNIAATIFNLENPDILKKTCSRQSYDNSANMAGKYSGLRL